MPDHVNYTSKAPFSADILVRQESHTLTPLNERGYPGTPIQIEGGIMLSIKVSADSLQALQTKIAGHIALIE